MIIKVKNNDLNNMSLILKNIDQGLVKLIFLIIFLYFFALIQNVYPQGISWIKINDNISHPLMEYDNGISISYFILNYGSVAAYLKTNTRGYEIFSNKQIVYGKGSFEISKNKLLSIFTLAQPITRAQIEMTHQSYIGKKYSNYRISFNVLIEAPFGYELKNYPEAPPLLSFPKKPESLKTNYMKRKTRGLSIFGITLGVGTSIGGLIMAKDDLYTFESGCLLAGGIILAYYSYNKLYYYVEDYELNNYYRNLNETAIQNWNITKTEIERNNSIRLQNWENERKRIFELNTIIKNTVTIKFSF
jgi:hypothetical protein